MTYLFNTVRMIGEQLTTSGSEGILGRSGHTGLRVMQGGPGRGLRRLFGGGMMGHGRHGDRSGSSTHHSSDGPSPQREPIESDSSKEAVDTDPALTILRERYARGEIDEEDFTKRHETLQSMQ